MTYQESSQKQMKTYTLEEVIQILRETQDRIYGCGNGKGEIDKTITKLLNDK